MRIQASPGLPYRRDRRLMLSLRVGAARAVLQLSGSRVALGAATAGLALFILCFCRLAVAQEYSGDAQPGYVPLPGCKFNRCTTVVVPATGPSCSSVKVSQANIGRVGGCTTGAGYQFTGDNPIFGSHARIRATDYNDRPGDGLETRSSGGAQFWEYNDRMIAFESTGGSIFLKTFDPDTLTLSPISSFGFTSPIAFSQTTPFKLYYFGHITGCPSNCMQDPPELSPPEIDAVYLGTMNGGSCGRAILGNSPCILSTTELFNFLPVANGGNSDKCLDGSYANYSWSSEFNVSKDDQSFTVGVSHGAQQTGTVVASYNVGLGCLVWHTDYGIITGDWGVRSTAAGDCVAFDGTQQCTGGAIALDWFPSTSFQAGESISPYAQNSAHCVFVASSTNDSGSTEPNWDSLDGGSCEFTGTIRDGSRQVWRVSTVNDGINPGVCGAGCKPITDSIRFMIHDLRQDADPLIAQVGATSPQTCLTHGECPNLGASLGTFIWTKGTLNVTSCGEAFISSLPDWTPNTPLNKYTDSSDLVRTLIDPKIGNPTPFLYEITNPPTGGVTGAPGSEPTWPQTLFDTVDDNTITWAAVGQYGATGFCDGHPGTGYTHLFNGRQFNATVYQNPTTNYPATEPASLSIPIDWHNTWNNADPQDLNPFAISTSDADDPLATAFFNSTGAFWDELILIFPCYTNPGCGTYLRMGQTFNTGVSQYFATANAIPNISRSGNYLMYASDMGGTLGDIDGNPTCSIDGKSGMPCNTAVIIEQLRVPTVR